jgi:hypothetical protein
MARFIQAEYPTEHAGIVRFTKGIEALASFSATRFILHALAVVGSPVTRAAGKVRGLVAASTAARKQRREDEKLWNIALSDARVMADLSRAMSADALRDTRGYF